MDPIICSNSVEEVISSIRNYLKEKKIIQDICLIEQNNDRVVFIVGDQLISPEMAKIWWSGYKQGMQIALKS